MSVFNKYLDIQFQQQKNNDAISYYVLPLGLLGLDNNILHRALEIDKTLPERYDHKTGIDRIRDMYKDFIINIKVFYALDNYLYAHNYGHLEINDYTIFAFQSYKPVNKCMFIDARQKTYQLSRFKMDYNDSRWHNADFKLVYLSRKLYKLTEKNTLNYVCDVNIID